jgi:hypothetical protein
MPIAVHHIPRQQDRITNWSEYDAGLRQRGSLTVWFSKEAISAWRSELGAHLAISVCLRRLSARAERAKI